MAQQYLIVLAVFMPMILGVLGARNASITTETMVMSYGFPVETHKVTTNDGYILTMHRIPYSKNRPVPTKPLPVVFIQHGLLFSSLDWTVLGEDRGLAFLLSNAGFDVWMGNARGNTYSRAHKTLDPNSSKFWDFDWHEIGTIDLPAMIDYVLAVTGAKKLSYIGHSQGTTAYFILNSLNPEYNKKFEQGHMLAPVAYMGHVTSPFYTYLAQFLARPTVLFPTDLLGSCEFNPSEKLIAILGKIICKKDQPYPELCSNILFLAAGFDDETIDPTIIDLVKQYSPSTASTKQFLHYMQEYNSKKFREFDYGIWRNLIHYKQTSPPEYPIGQIDVPTYMYYSDNDSCAAVEDVEQLMSELNCFVKACRIPNRKFDHLGFLFNAKIKEQVYDLLINNMINNTATGRRY